MTVSYSAGKDNPADYMWRHPDPSTTSGRSSERVEEYINFVQSHAKPIALSLEEIKKATQTDAILQTVINHHRSNTMYKIKNSHKSFWNRRNEISVTEDGILLKEHRIIVPQSLRDRVIQLAHQGMTKTKSLLRTKVWFPQMDNKTEQMIKECIPCQATTPQVQRSPLK